MEDVKAEGQLTQPDVGTPEPKPTEPVATPPVQPGADSVAGKVDGQEDVVRKYESTVGRLGAELDQARRQAEYYRMMAESAGQEKPVEKPKPGITDEDFIRSPIEVLDKFTDAKLERFRAEQMQKEQQNYVRASQRNFEVGKSQAIKVAPKLYSGIEKPVEDLVFESWRSGTISGEQLSDPNVWQSAAAIYRYAQGEYDLGKYIKTSAPTPVSPVHTEVPVPGGGPKEDEVILSDEQKLVARMWDQGEGKISEKDVAEGIKADRRKTRGGGR